MIKSYLDNAGGRRSSRACPWTSRIALEIRTNMFAVKAEGVWLKRSARRGPSAASTSRSRRGRSPASSAPTAPANRPSSACSSACFAPTRGRSRSPASTWPASPSQVKDRIGYMPQHFSLYGDLTVAENMKFFADLYGVPEGRLRRAQGGAARIQRPGPLRGPARPESLRRDAEEARPGLQSLPHAGDPPPRRADDRRRSRLPAGALAASPRAQRPGTSRS